MESTKEVIQLSLDNVEIARFKSARLAAIQFGGKMSDKIRIHNVANISNHSKTYKGYKWKYSK